MIEIVVRVDPLPGRRGDDEGGKDVGGRLGARTAGHEEYAVYVLADLSDRAEEKLYPGSVPRGAGGRRSHVGADVLVPHDDKGDVVHVRDVVVHDPGKLCGELHRALLGRVHEGLAEKVERNGSEEEYRHDDDDGESPEKGGLDAADLHSDPPRDLRYSEGVIPVRFLKSEAK